MLSGKFLLKSQIPYGDAFVSTEAKAPLLLAPVLAVQLAIADSLRDVGAPDVGGVVKVSDGACHFEDSVVGSGREIIASHGGAEHVGGVFVQAGILFQKPASHLGVAVDAGAVLETLGLNLSCFFHTLTNHGT